MQDAPVELVNVSAIIVTRGDLARAEFHPIIASFPEGFCKELLIWENTGTLWRYESNGYFIRSWAEQITEVPDLAVYGRYAAIEHARGDLIYVQDDDMLHKPEGIQEIVDQWYETEAINQAEHVEDPLDFVVCNMPANFRHSFYQEHALVGFGACFHRSLPEEAFASFWTGVTFGTIPAVDTDTFNRTCDIVFTALTPRVLVDVPYEDMPWASADNRMWKQSTHREERGRMLDLVLKVRDA